MAASNYSKSKIARHTFGLTAWTMPAAIWVRLYTAITDAAAGTGTEATYTGYDQVNITALITEASGVMSNSSQVTFGACTASGQTITHFGFWDAESGGNPLAALTALTTSRAVGVGDTPRFAIGELTATVS